MIEENSITAKHVDEVLVASLRLHGRYDEVPSYFDVLRRQVKPYIKGKGIILYYGPHPDGGVDVEVCFPVTQAVVTDQVQSWVLPGGEVLSAIHTGSYAADGVVGGRTKTWQDFIAYIFAHKVSIAEDPVREIRVEDAEEHGTETSQYVTEIQLVTMLPQWLRRFVEGLDRHIDAPARRHVMAGSEGITAMSAPDAVADWMTGAMARVDAALPDERTRWDILTQCGHRFPDDRIRAMREEYERQGDLDRLLKVMRQDRTVRGMFSWYEVPEREGHVITVGKDPADPVAFLQAPNEVERRVAYCHCGMMKEAIRSQKQVSPTFCFCGAGWYRRLWEGILGQPVYVEVLTSVMQGDDRCTFAVHLPDSVMV
jgi:effector-binding domain-containing protein